MNFCIYSEKNFCIHSTVERKMIKILNELNISFKYQFRLKNYSFDFRILDTNILIEVDGDYYHGNPKIYSKLNKIQLKQKQKDIKHNEMAKINSYVLLRFWGSDVLKNKEKIIQQLNEKMIS